MSEQDSNRAENEPRAAEPAPPPAYQQPARPTPATLRQSGIYKMPLLAGFLSFMPGLGNIYNGLYLRGVAFFLTFVGVLSLLVTVAEGGHGEESEAVFLGFTLAFVGLFNIFDAYRQATLINSGQTTDLGLSDQPRMGSGGMVPGVALIVVGAYGLLQKVFDLDFSWLVEQWPFLLLAFGGFLVYQSVRQRREAADADSSY